MSARIQGAGPTGSEGHPIAFVSVAPGASMSSLNAARVQGAGPLGTEGDPVGAVILGTGGVAFTPGSVIFAGAGGALAEDNANLFWDNSNNRLGIGTNSPGATLHVAGIISSPDSGTQSQRFGLGSSASGDRSTAIGFNSLASGNESLAVGWDTEASATSTTAVGRFASATHSGATCLGRSSTSTAANQFVCGSVTNAITGVFFGAGPASANGADCIINGTGRSGSNLGGGILTIAGGRGTGTGVGGAVRFAVAPAGASGSTQNALNIVARWDAGASGGRFGCFSQQNAPVAQQNVTGSRGGNAALANLLTALANYGWITDSTTA